MMKKTIIETIIHETDSILELDADDQQLIAAANEAAARSWSPYSGFSVGAAVRLSDGTIVPGCNIENAAFPSGICAEHNALSSAAALYPYCHPVAMAITASMRGKTVDEPVAPCGKCRQVIIEEETRHNQQIRIILAGNSKCVVVDRGSDLLPLLFSQKDLSLGEV